MRFLTLLSAIAIASAAVACENCRLKEQGYHIGEMTILGNGTIFTWAQVDKDGKPVAVGVTVSELALSGLREDLPEGYPKVPGWEYKLDFPVDGVKGTPFNHLSFDWNPKGHIPPGIYDVPHFDVHFYMVSYDDRLKMTMEGDGIKKFQNKPQEAFMPAGYIYAPESEEAKMGAHWVDLATPELNGKPFTHTFIYGSYDAKVVFWEPMITRAMFTNDVNIEVDIKQPEKVAVSSHYPTKYFIRYNAIRKEYVVGLEKFVWREAAK